MGVNEQIKAAKSLDEVKTLAAQHQPMASEKTLRRRQRLVKKAVMRFNPSR